MNVYVIGMEWKPVVVRFLIDQHRENLAHFNDPSAKTAEVWQKITENISERFPGVFVEKSKVDVHFILGKLCKNIYKHFFNRSFRNGQNSSKSTKII